MSPLSTLSLFHGSKWSTSLLGLLIGGLVQTAEQGAYLMLHINASPSYKARIIFAAIWAGVITLFALMMSALCRQIVKLTILSQINNKGSMKKSIHQSIMHKTDLRLLLGALVGAECSVCVVEMMVNTDNMWQRYACMLGCWLGLGMLLQHYVEQTLIRSHGKEKDNECDDDVLPTYSELA